MNDFQEKKASSLQLSLETPSFPQPQRQGRWTVFTLPALSSRWPVFLPLPLPWDCFHGSLVFTRVPVWSPRTQRAFLRPSSQRLSQPSPLAMDTRHDWSSERQQMLRRREERYYRNFQLSLCKVLQCSFRCRFAWKIIRIFFPFPRESSEVNHYPTIKRALCLCSPCDDSLCWD